MSQTFVSIRVMVDHADQDSFRNPGGSPPTCMVGGNLCARSVSLYDHSQSLVLCFPLFLVSFLGGE